MTKREHLICETVQYITIDAWRAIYGDDNKYDLDSRDLLIEFRYWGEEFENWWDSLSEDERESKYDYQLELDKFTDKKVAEYLSILPQHDSCKETFVNINHTHTS